MHFTDLLLKLLVMNGCHVDPTDPGLYIAESKNTEKDQ